MRGKDYRPFREESCGQRRANTDVFCVSFVSLLSVVGNPVSYIAKCLRPDFAVRLHSAALGLPPTKPRKQKRNFTKEFVKQLDSKSI